MNIAVSQQAAEKIKFFLAKRGAGIGLRIGVKTTGCSGLAYKLEYVDSVNSSTDILFETQGVKIIIEEQYLSYLDGITLDYTQEKLAEGFKFINPNVKAECGCGKSFTI